MKCITFGHNYHVQAAMSAWLKACQLCVLLSVVPALLSSPAQADTEELEVMTSSHHDTLLICVLCRLSTMIRRQWPRLCHRWRTWGSEPSRDPRHTTSVSGKGEDFLWMFISIHQKYLFQGPVQLWSWQACLGECRRGEKISIQFWCGEKITL